MTTITQDMRYRQSLMKHAEKHGVSTQRAILNIQGGVIRNNIANYGGAVDAFGNSRINMTSGTVSGNTAILLCICLV